MIRVAIEGVPYTVEAGEKVRSLLKKHAPKMFESALAIKVNNVLSDVNAPLNEGDNVKIVNLGSDEGYRIYRESILEILRMAAHTVYPGKKLYVRQSVNKSTYFEIAGAEDSAEEAVSKLSGAMRGFIDADEAFDVFEVSKEKAKKLFLAQNEPERARRLDYLPKKTVRLCRGAGRVDVVYETLARTTACMKVFEITPRGGGFLLRYPNPHTNGQIPEITASKKLYKTLESHREWSRIINVADVFELDKAILQGRGGDIITLAEALHEKRIGEIADAVKARFPEIRVVSVAGPSASGKTTFAARLTTGLRLNGLEPYVISLDNYYIDKARMKAGEDGDLDFESLDAIDHAMFSDNILKLIAGGEVALPRFNFKTAKSEPDAIVLNPSANSVFVVEGIHALNEKLYASIPRKNIFRIYCSALTSMCFDDYNPISPTDTRLLRRLVRDHGHRNASAEYTFDLWANVRRGERNNIFPFEGAADEIFNSALIYEFSALKEDAETLLGEIPKGNRHYSEAVRLLDILSYFEKIDKTAIPPNSIIREFIGTH